jgi:hypothetical protein
MINIPNLNTTKSNNPYMQLINQSPAAQLPIIATTAATTPAQMDNSENLLYDINNNILKLLEKKIKNKKNTYLKITKAMFDTDILSQYPDFPQDKYNMVYSDGVDYFIEIGNKKYPLTKKFFLKFINYILK